MKLRAFLEFLCVLLSLSAYFVSATIKLEDYAKLIAKVLNQNKESSVTIFHYFEFDTFLEKEYLFKITTLLSKRKILSVTADFRDWHSMRQHYWEKNKEQIHGRRPMFVILLSDQQSLSQFQNMSNELKSEEQLFFLVLFIETDQEHLREFCLNPGSDSFKVRLDTLMVVKCYDDDKLRAWYTLDGNKMKVSTWAIWDPQIEFLTMILDYKHKKIDLNGKELKIATVDASALTDWTEDDKLDGYFGQLLHELQGRMNFTWKLVKKVRDYGSWNATCNYWTGATNLLYKNEIDLLVTDLSLSSLRMTAIDFTIPLLHVHSILYVQKPQSGTDIVKWLGYFKFFDVRIWMALILVILITPLILTVLKIKIRKSYYVSSQLLLENYLNIWGIYCQQGLLEYPTATPLRLVYFSIFVSALIIFTYYSAILISRLTYPMPNAFLPDMEAFIQDGTYKLITLKNGADYNIFEFANTPALKAMFKLMMTTDELPESVQAGFDMVCKQKVGFFVVQTARKIHNLQIKCKLHEIKTNFIELSAMALPKYSQYKSEINRNFFRFEVNGMLRRFYKEYFYLETLEDPRKFQVTIWEIAVLLAIVAAGIILSITILIIEKISFLYKMTNTVKRAGDNKDNKNSTKQINFKNQKINPDHYDLNVKFKRKNNEYRILVSGVNKVSFEL